ncbi:MAG: hypothetical protein LBV53_01820 [Mycoplasmataceae bacterium]|jgi:X-X-X-Leu-X-X-Gly heptad repeat protein|nr:hypothetical protein [Mycoplasmataceae bacterium]
MANKKMRILDAKHNKELIGDELKFQYIIDGTGGDSMTLKTLSNKVDTLADKLNKLADIVDKGFKEMREGFKQVNARIDNLVKKNNLKE